MHFTDRKFALVKSSPGNSSDGRGRGFNAKDSESPMIAAEQQDKKAAPHGSNREDTHTSHTHTNQNHTTRTRID